MLAFERPDSELWYSQTDECFWRERLDVLVVPLIVILREQWLLRTSALSRTLVLSCRDRHLLEDHPRRAILMGCRRTRLVDWTVSSISGPCRMVSVKAAETRTLGVGSAACYLSREGGMSLPKTASRMASLDLSSDWNRSTSFIIGILRFSHCFCNR